jgi:predicted ester cyclase
MSSETNKTIVRRFIEECSNGRNDALLEQIISPDWVSHGTQSANATAPPLPRGVEGIKQLQGQVFSIWPDNRWTIEDMIAEEDKVVVRMTSHATHRGEYRGIAATGRHVTFSAIWIYRLVDGKIVEAWRSADDLGRIMQIGGAIIPTGHL